MNILHRTFSSRLDPHVAFKEYMRTCWGLWSLILRSLVSVETDALLTHLNEILDIFKNICYMASPGHSSISDETLYIDNEITLYLPKEILMQPK